MGFALRRRLTQPAHTVCSHSLSHSLLPACTLDRAERLLGPAAGRVRVRARGGVKDLAMGGSVTKC